MPACGTEADKPDENGMILEAVDDLKRKSCSLQDALRLALAKGKRLANTKNMECTGCLKLTPNGPAPTPPPKASTVTIKSEPTQCCAYPAPTPAPVATP